MEHFRLWKNLGEYLYSENGKWRREAVTREVLLKPEKDPEAPRVLVKHIAGFSRCSLRPDIMYF